MKRGRSTGNLTRSQQARFDAIGEIGCIVCLKQGIESMAERHHLTVGGKHGQKRRGHDFSIGLCSWHHTGGRPESWTVTAMADYFGPSYALSPLAFRDEFGSDDALLDYQNDLLRIYGLRAA